MITVGQAAVKLIADATDLPKQLGNAQKETKGWAEKTAGIAKTALTGLVVGGATIAAGAVASIGKAAWDMAGDHQGAMVEVRAQFGQTEAEATRTAELARKAWGDNWGASITDVATAMGQVQQQLGELGVTSDQAITDASTKAIALRDVYGIEVAESIDAVRSLMENFGLSAEQAYDFIAKGQQDGLNRTGDFLDSITEYGVQFSEAGAEADQFFSAMSSGLQGGMLGTDKAADAFKEFRVRIMDGSATTADALASLGFNVEEFMNSLSNGDMTVVEAWEHVQRALKETDDQALQMQAGVGLIGTQFEDLGADVVLAMDLAGAGMEQFEGAADKAGAKYTSFPQLFEATKRKLLTAIAPLSDTLLKVADMIMPKVQEGIEKFSAIAAPIFETISGLVESFFGNLEEGMRPLDAFIEAIWDIAPPEVLDFLINLRDNVLPGLTKFFEEKIQPILDWVKTFVSWKDILIILAGVVAAVVIPALISIVTTMAPIILVVLAVVGVVALLRNAWENNWGGIQDKLKAVWEFIQPILASVWAWLQEKVPQALEWLRKTWVETVWPAIQTAIETVWPIIEGIFESLKSWVEEDLIPTIRELWLKWTTVWWPAIRKALVEAWEKIEPVLKSLKEWFMVTLPENLRNIRQKFEEAWGAVREAVQPVFDLFSSLWDKVQGFWEWIQNKVFNFKVNLPELPDWLWPPGSPIPVHRYLKAFADELPEIQAQINRSFGGMNLNPAAVPAGGGSSDNRTYNYNLTLAGGGDRRSVIREFEILQGRVA